jgi:hypothetical protein
MWTPFAVGVNVTVPEALLPGAPCSAALAESGVADLTGPGFLWSCGAVAAVVAFSTRVPQARSVKSESRQTIERTPVLLRRFIALLLEEKFLQDLKAGS